MYIVTAIGIILVLEGIPYFAFPSTMRRWAVRIASLSDRELRIVGLMSMAAGIAILYGVRYYMR